ncbi:retinol dehydrogenase 12-like [Daphnia pulex]|uniref:retinol dehydrogenase 12-like n=1 Tax=Daphnia pulex TaxID=6669 RepID=UPI001EDE16FD|nr:retinol dehydrogenase 12-like [Daphnia pulex]
MPRFFQGPRCKNAIGLDGKIAVITGANTGIGKETARELSKRGAEVVLACRDLNKAEEAADEIAKETGNKVTTLKLNLASLKSIRAAAEELRARHPQIHILINNAGIMTCPQWKTDDGFEMQFGVNHLGSFLWTLLLIDNIKQAAPSRIVNLSSLAHTRGKIYFDDLMLAKNYTPVRAYCQSKLANVLFTQELARRLEGTGVSVFAVHPGAVQTELARHINESMNSCVDGTLHFVSRYVFKTPEMGAQTSIYCATEESLTELSGHYFSDCAKKKPAKQANDKKAAERLWKMSEELVGLNSFNNPSE